MTYWWAIALILSCLQLSIARWRDLGSAVIVAYVMAILMEQLRVGSLHWGFVSVGLGCLALSWRIGAHRGITRPKLNGLSLFVAGLCLSVPSFANLISPDIPSEAMCQAIAVTCSFFTAIFFVLALERARPVLGRSQGRRVIPVTTGQQ